jgi:3-oxoisoapionate decarboxylase
MRPGISTYTYTWAIGVQGNVPSRPLSYQALLEKALELDVRCVQIADNLALHIHDKSSHTRMADMARKMGISIEIGARGLTPVNLRNYLSMARIFDSPILRFVIDGPGFEPTLVEIKRIIRENLSEVKNAGIKLAIENHDRFKSIEFESMILETDPEWIGICLDSVNSMGAAEGIETVADKLAPYTLNLHIKDFEIRRVDHKMGFNILGKPAGQGMLNIPDLVAKVASFNQCRSAILELWTPPAADLDSTIVREAQWARESIDYLKSIL